MQNILVAAALAAGLVLAGQPAQAQNYVVNSRAASAEDVQLLVSYGFQPGRWVVNGYGIAAAENSRQAVATAGDTSRKCRYVLDVLLCD